MMPVRYAIAGAVLLALGLAYGLTTADARSAADDKATPLMTKELVGAPDAKALIAAQAKVIKDALAKGDKKSLTKARVAAMLVALAAQTTGQTGTRNQALKVADAIGKDNTTAAKQAANGLPGGANAGGAAGPVALQTMIDITDLMSVFKLAKAGGQELEKQLPGLTKRPDAEKVKLFATQVAIISLYTEELKPEPAGGKDPKDWVQYTHDLRGNALAALKAAKAKDTAGMKRALRSMDETCNNCHMKFRD